MTRVFANVCSVGSDESAHLLKLTLAFTRLCDQYPIYWHIYNTCLERYSKSTRKSFATCGIWTPDRDNTSAVVATDCATETKPTILFKYMMGGSIGEGGQGPDPLSPSKISKIGFHSNTGPDPLKKLNATKPAFNVGPSSERCFACEPMMALF